MRTSLSWVRSVLLLLMAWVVGSTGSAGVASGAEPVTLTFGWWGNVAIMNDYEKVFERFHEMNPDIRIEGIHWGYSGDAQQKYTVQVATDTAPDIFMIPTVFPEALLPLDQYLARTPQLAAQLLPDGLQYWRLSMDGYGVTHRGEGQQLGLPLYSFATAIAYNKTMFAEAGIDAKADWTYSEFEQTARQLTRDVNGDGIPDIWGTTWHLQSGTGLDPIIAAHGDWPLYNEDPLDTIIDSPSVQEGLEVVRRWMQEFRIHRPPAAGGVSFPGQNVATIQGHNDTFLGFPQAIDGRFEWDIAPMPAGPRGRTSIAFHQGLGINAKTRNPEEAWRFVEFFLGEEGAKLQNQSILRLSANVAAAQDYVERAPFSAGVIIESFNHAIRTGPGVPTGVNVAMELYPVWNGEESVRHATERIARLIRSRLTEIFK